MWNGRGKAYSHRGVNGSYNRFSRQKYFRPTDNEKLQEYKKAISDLTISEENKLRLQVKEEKTNSQRQLEKITAEIGSIKEEAMARVLAKGQMKPL